MSENGTDRSEVFRVERWNDYPKGEEPACADCGAYRDLIGPATFDGEIQEGGDMVCPECAETRGLDLTRCTCGTSSPRDQTCPGCGDYLGYGSAARSSTGTDRPEGQVCPNPGCEIDQRWEGFRGHACPECGSKLVVACSCCDSGAVYEDEEETPYCSDHDPRKVATDGGTDEDDTTRDAPTTWTCKTCDKTAISAVEPKGCTCGESSGFDKADSDCDHGGRGLPEGYERVEGELSSHQYALVELLQEAEFVCAGTTDDAPKYQDDIFVFVFDHPDHEGGLMVPMQFGDLQVTRAIRTPDGDWTMEEDVSVFEELPDWVNHHPGDASEQDGGRDV